MLLSDSFLIYEPQAYNVEHLTRNTTSKVRGTFKLALELSNHGPMRSEAKEITMSVNHKLLPVQC